MSSWHVFLVMESVHIKGELAYIMQYLDFQHHQMTTGSVDIGFRFSFEKKARI